MMMMAMANDKVKVIITDSQKKVRIPTGLRMLVRRACIATLREEDFKGNAEVNVTFVDDEKIRKACSLEYPVRLVITVGYPKDDDPLRNKKRKPLDELVSKKA